MKSIIIAITVLLATGSALAGEMQQMPMPKEFESLKQLLGTWQGTAKMGSQDIPVTVIYELTSGATAITEKLMPGTPKEMISIYHKDGDKVSMTHYCAMGNSPAMSMKKSDAKVTQFEMLKPVGVSSINEPHMHSVTLTRIDENTLRQEWEQYENGKKKDAAVFDLKRKI